jgi:hypothetical protein
MLNVLLLIVVKLSVMAPSVTQGVTFFTSNCDARQKDSVDDEFDHRMAMVIRRLGVTQWVVSVTLNQVVTRFTHFFLNRISKDQLLFLYK